MGILGPGLRGLTVYLVIHPVTSLNHRHIIKGTAKNKKNVLIALNRINIELKQIGSDQIVIIDSNPWNRNRFLTFYTYTQL